MIINLIEWTAIILGGLGFYHFAWTVVFAIKLRRSRVPTSLSRYPFVSVLLPLRGADPELSASLERILNQDYPAYELRVIVDSAEDPAIPVVRAAEATAKPGAMHVSILAERTGRCSPQCASLAQAVEELSDRTEVIAIMDGDVVAHPTWIRELVAPLLDPSIGAAHGNRWYSPADAQWGSLCRYIWNAGAVIPMWVFGIPWSGTFAIRRDAANRIQLAEIWKKSLVPDGPCATALNRSGLKLRFVASLMMVNRERCNLSFALDFIRRQMTWTKTYLGNWPIILTHAFLLVTFLLASTGFALDGFWRRDAEQFLWGTMGILGFTLGSLGGVLCLERAVNKIVRRRGQPSMDWNLPAVAKLPLAGGLLLFVYAISLFLAHFRRTVTWRGVRYHIRGRHDIHVLSDTPFQQTSSPDAGVSL